MGSDLAMVVQEIRENQAQILEFMREQRGEPVSYRTIKRKKTKP